MLKYIFKRLLQGIPVFFVVIVVTFFMVRQAPGGPFDDERAVSPQVLKSLNARYNLDAPMLVQLKDYVWNLAQGDFGPSFKYPNRSVSEMIFGGFPITLELSLYALLIALFIGLPAGILAALKRNTWLDYLPMSVAMLGICLPAFVLGPLLVLIFSVYLEWLPVSGWGLLPGDKVLPSVTLGICYAAYIARITRGGMIDVLSQDYVRTAHAKGVPYLTVVCKHMLRAGLTPVISFLGPAFAGLLAGSFVIETLFQVPGLGRLYINAAFNRDYTMIMGGTIFFAGLIVVVNMATDILLTWLDPRLRQKAFL